MIKNLESFNQSLILHFDSTDSIDVAEMERERRLAMEAHPFLPEEETIGTVVDARRHFAKKRFDHQYRWKLTDEIGTAIATSLFGWMKRDELE